LGKGDKGEKKGVQGWNYLGKLLGYSKAFKEVMGLRGGPTGGCSFTRFVGRKPRELRRAEQRQKEASPWGTANCWRKCWARKNCRKGRKLIWQVGGGHGISGRKKTRKGEDPLQISKKEKREG